jgi:hypothetical protein
MLRQLRLVLWETGVSVTAAAVSAHQNISCLFLTKHKEYLMTYFFQMPHEKENTVHCTYCLPFIVTKKPTGPLKYRVRMKKARRKC